MTTLDTDKELLILSLVAYICKKERKPDFVIDRIHNLLIDKKLVRSELIDVNKTTDRIDFVQNMLDEISLDVTTTTDITPYDHSNVVMTKYINKLYSLTTTTNNYSLDDLVVQDNSRCFQNFIKVSLLGTGGFGSVHQVYSILDHSMYAIKRIVIDTRYKKLNYYLNEVNILAKTHHENIIRYYSTWLEFQYLTIDELNSASDSSDTSAEDVTSNSNSNSNNNNTTNDIVPYGISNPVVTPVLYIQMELCTTTLKQYLIDRNTSSQKITISEVNKIMKQLINAIRYLNTLNIVHQDVTTQNVFIKYDNNDEVVVKLGDFGLSNMMTDTSGMLQCSRSFVNSFYVAPELINTKNIEANYKSSKVDVFSLGVIYYELLNKFSTVMERAIELKKLRDWIMNVETPTQMQNVLSGIETNDIDVNILILMLHPDPNERIDIDTLHSKFNLNINLS